VQVRRKRWTRKAARGGATVASGATGIAGLADIARIWIEPTTASGGAGGPNLVRRGGCAGDAIISRPCSARAARGLASLAVGIAVGVRAIGACGQARRREEVGVIPDQATRRARGRRRRASGACGVACGARGRARVKLASWTKERAGACAKRAARKASSASSGASATALRTGGVARLTNVAAVGILASRARRDAGARIIVHGACRFAGQALRAA